MSFSLTGCVAVDTASGIPKARPPPIDAPIISAATTTTTTSSIDTTTIPLTESIVEPIDASTTSAYVTRLLTSSDILLAAHTLGSVDILDAATLRRVHWLPHVERLQCPVLHSAAVDGAVVATCGANGTLAEWDIRTGELIHAYNARACSPHVLACALDSASHATLCGGSQGVVMWFDQRTRSSVRVLADLHSDDVTVLTVAERGVVLSGADDALICELQLDGAASLADDAADSDAANDDDAYLRGCVNVEDAVQHLLVCGARRDAIACLTNVAVSVWDRGSLAPRFAIADHRPATAAAAALPAIDYTVGFHFDAASDQLLALAGADDGSLVLTAVTPDALLPIATLSNGHYAPVRAFAVHSSDLLFTGAEDGNICSWRRSSEPITSSSSGSNSSGNSSIGGPMRNRRTNNNSRLNPF
jgi:WD40 repeat protein